ncbi:MAG TPA: selenocysteine-specific translation elongation factor [Acidimicrobiales bacterium]|nr:selenocysteine-specific translation elongation factor [Acidimicrobiales bacterium]
MHVISTAGHVDHGKSTLVHTLTGIDPDRWAEEKARGLTIDLGFASCKLPSGRAIAIIDVPGHVRFIKNMLAGVGAVDACIFVVAATEGWKPQSEEHLRILELLGVQHGVVALTKVGVADDDLRELARLDVEEHVAGTFLEGAELIEVDCIDGIGVDDLRSALDRLLDSTPAAADVGRPRLWIDRAFAAKGAGTVATGTLTGGRLRVDDEVVLWPAGRLVRIRGLQSHHESRTKIGPGNRVAVNLSGLSHEDVERGHVLVAPDQWHVTQRVDAELRVLDSLTHVVSRRGAYVAYVGSGEQPVKLRILGPNSIAPGQVGLVRMHLREGVPLLPGDRFVLRESGRAETVGGGEVLDVEPIVPASRARPDRSVDRVIAERRWIEPERLRLLTGERRAPTVGKWVVDPADLERITASLRDRVAAAGPLGLDVASLNEHERAALTLLDEIAVESGRARPRGQADPLADHPYVAALEASLLAPPDPVGVDRGELRELVKSGRVVEVDGVYFSPAAFDQAAALCAHLLRDHPDGFTVADFRDAAHNSRKHALPILNRLDGTGVLRRRGDQRIAGPRMP